MNRTVLFCRFGLSCLCIWAAALSMPSWSQDAYPNKPIRMLTATSPGAYRKRFAAV